MKAFNQLIENKDEILLGYETVLQTLTDTTVLEKKRTEFQGEYDIVTELMRKCVEENARTTLDQEEYTRKYSVFLLTNNLLCFVLHQHCMNNPIPDMLATRTGNQR